MQVLLRKVQVLLLAGRTTRAVGPCSVARTYELD